MSDDLTKFRSALASGEPDQVNAAIEDLEAMDAEKRTELFNDAFEMCLDLYDEGDGYQRQSVVRFVRELLSRQQLLAIFKHDTEKDLCAHLTLAEVEAHIKRLEAFYVAALDDDDGRVRQADIKGINHLSTAYQVGDDDDRLDDLLETLNGLLGETTGKKHEYVERARDEVELNRRGPSLDKILGRISDDT